MLKNKKNIIIGIISLVLIAGLSMIGVRASERFAPVTINNVENLTMNVEGSADDMGEMLGGGTRFPNGISADSTSPSAGEVRGTTLTTTGAVTLGGAATLSSTLDVSGATALETLTQGGGRTASSTTNATETMLLSYIDTENYFDYTPNINTTLTLMASTTMTDFIPNVGDMREIVVRNASSTAAATVTFAAGTGIDLQFTEATGGDLVLNGLDIATMKFIRKNDTDVLVLFNEFTEAD